MRAVIQRVQNASVFVNDQLISQIGKGLCVLVGISRDDTREDMDYIVRKILNTRLFDNRETGKRWSDSVVDRDYEILSVSQFTLYGNLKKGNKPDFHQSMDTKLSEDFYNEFLDKLRTGYKSDRVKDGQFGAMMAVNICNDGPVTITLESPTTTNKSTQQTDKPTNS
ncbi:D-aminoacyl-tRNA deacylase-like [Oppia nitens]|uniref:D-aminoacyl-tRNA deacylase-like n=1 Tax=Oppia nitens TaxID=1686743 RepID=UPI0023DB3F6D|nr:D-aminoacyl-tRNA deacylase-like [Oppia nitens]